MKLVINNKHEHVQQIKAATLQFQARCGAFFREKRLLQDKTEEEAARLLNVPVETLRDYESGKAAIPLYHVDALSHCLEIPSVEIMELHLDLENKIMPGPLFEQHFIDGKNVGRIVQQARKTIFMSAKRLAHLLSKSGYLISENELIQIENAKKQTPVEFWMNFCTLTHLHLDAIHGYSRWHHLARINVALQNDELRIPAGSRLMNALENYHLANEANNHKISYLLEFSLAFRSKIDGVELNLTRN